MRSRCLPIALLILASWFSPVFSGEPVLPTIAGQVRPWTNYQAIMWVADSAYKDPAKILLFYQRLKDMGINAAMVYGDGDLRPVLDSRFPYYVENIVNRGLCLKWNSKVTDWDKFITAWSKDGRPESAFVRDYCLDDPDWREWAQREVARVAGKNRPHLPLAYNLRDELSTTVSANPFDYDFQPASLAGFRKWLRTQYPDLAALNAEWETRFNSWDEVKPFSTDQIKNRMSSGQALPGGKPDWGELQRLQFDPSQARRNSTRWNCSPWADFRTYMDIALARVLEDLRKIARQADPETPVGIEGTQMPHAFGGYDLWRLSQVIDWVEPYDIGNAREIFGSFMPGKTLLTTVFEKETKAAARRLWHLLLEGDRGCIIWWSEDCIDPNDPDRALTPKARALAPVLKEMTSPLASLFLRAKPEFDPVYIHYSQPSLQVDWLLESTVDGPTWVRRLSSFEADHNQLARTRNGWLKALQDLGFSPQFVASEQIETGAWPSAGACGLVLPQARAMSDMETVRLQALYAAGQLRLLCEGAPGVFDGHGKLRREGPFETLVPPSGPAVVALQKGRAEPSGMRGAQYAADRVKAGSDWPKWIAQQLAPLQPAVRIDPALRVRVHRYQLGPQRLLAFERNINYHMGEDLKQAGGNEPLERPVEVAATLDGAAHVYDLRALTYLGKTDRLRFTLDPWRPSLFALTQAEIKGDLLQTLTTSAPQ